MNVVHSTSNPSFLGMIPRKMTAGVLHADKDNRFPFRVHAWDEVNYQVFHDLKAEHTFYGFVHEGIAELTYFTHNGYQLTHIVAAGMSFCVVGNFSIVGGTGVLIERKNFRGWPQIIGPIETEGRLKYIDGCTDSLLIPPVKKGDPCLNHLHFPPHITQTPHTHPSVRVGIVHNGYGVCVTPWGSVVLKPGMVFIIHENQNPTDGRTVVLKTSPDTMEMIEGIPGTHSFNTGETPMDVIAWHPDSDFGPADEDHPMVNRTIIDGRSARDIDAIRTR